MYVAAVGVLSCSPPPEGPGVAGEPAELVRLQAYNDDSL